MACLDMYNSDYKGNYPPVSPRISFSNDFAESQHFLKQDKSNNGGSSGSREAPASSDFEFSVSNYSMMSADELFSKGKLLPYNGGTQMQRTLREELLAGDDDSNGGAGVSFRPPKGSGRWKGFLGLKRSHAGSSKKAADGSSGSTDQSKKFGPVHEGTSVSNTSQGMSNEGGSNCRDFEFGM